MDLETISDFLDIKKNALYKIEEGYQKLSLPLAVKLTKIYECSIEELCDDLGIDINIEKERINKCQKRKNGM